MILVEICRTASSFAIARDNHHYASRRLKSEEILKKIQKKMEAQFLLFS